MKITVYCGDITKAPADAACSSTNPHLELVAGTGAALREAGGWEIQEQCRELIAQQFANSGHRFMDVGTVHWTTAGSLPMKGLIHAVAIDPYHHSSLETVQKCTIGALELAVEHQLESLAIPVFATGYGDVKFEPGLRAMMEALHEHQAEFPKEVLIVMQDEDKKAMAEKVVGTN